MGAKRREQQNNCHNQRHKAKQNGFHCFSRSPSLASAGNNPVTPDNGTCGKTTSQTCQEKMRTICQPEREAGPGIVRFRENCLGATRGSPYDLCFGMDVRHRCSRHRACRGDRAGRPYRSQQTSERMVRASTHQSATTRWRQILSETLGRASSALSHRTRSFPNLCGQSSVSVYCERQRWR